MMINFLKKLLSHKPHSDVIDAPELSADTLCQISKRLYLSPSLQLVVGAGQVAVLFNGQQRTSLYPTGVHDLAVREREFMHQFSQAQALYIQIAPPTIRQWSMNLTTDDITKIALKGQYSVAVENTKVLCDHLLSLNGDVATSTVDDWIGKILKEVMQAQHISIDDINQYRERLQKFLIDAINPILWDRGLSLRELIIHEAMTADESVLSHSSLTDAFMQRDSTDKASVSAQTDTGKTANEPSIAAPSSTPPNKPKQTSSQSEVRNFQEDLHNHSMAPNNGNNKVTTAKIYYRIVNGQQDGPYNIEQMQQLIDEQVLKPTDLIWTVGFPSWQRADSIKQLHWTHQ